MLEARAAGTFYAKLGGGSNYLCLPDVPQYTLRYTPGSQSYSEIHGTEYEHPIAGTHEHNVPCAVCSASTCVAVLMIPARTSCPTGWTSPLTMKIVCTGLIMSGLKSG